MSNENNRRNSVCPYVSCFLIENYLQLNSKSCFSHCVILVVA
jgi:hypothetical protein